MAGMEQDDPSNAEPLPQPNSQVTPNESCKENDEKKKGILKHARTYSNKHVDFNMDLEFVPFDETKDFAIEIQIVEKMPKKVISYAALFAEQKAQEEAEEKKKLEETKEKCKKFPKAHNKNESCKSKKCKLANSSGGLEGIEDEIHPLDPELHELQEENLCQCESNSQIVENINNIAECSTSQQDLYFSISEQHIPELSKSETEIKEEVEHNSEKDEIDIEEIQSEMKTERETVQLTPSNNVFEPLISEKNEDVSNRKEQITDLIGKEEALHKCLLNDEEALRKHKDILRNNTDKEDLHLLYEKDNIRHDCPVEELSVEMAEESLTPNLTGSNKHMHYTFEKDTHNCPENNEEVNSLVNRTFRRMKKLDNTLHSPAGDKGTESECIIIDNGGELQTENEEIDSRKKDNAREILEPFTLVDDSHPVEIACEIKDDSSLIDNINLNNNEHGFPELSETIENDNSLHIENEDSNKLSISVFETNGSNQEEELPVVSEIFEEENSQFHHHSQNICVSNECPQENENLFPPQYLKSILKNILKEPDIKNLQSTPKEDRKQDTTNKQITEDKEDFTDMTKEVINWIINFEAEGDQINQNNFSSKHLLIKENIEPQGKYDSGEAIQNRDAYSEYNGSNQIEEKRECILS